MVIRVNSVFSSLSKCLRVNGVGAWSEQNMASPSSPQHEPTMEEILASIRKIISEDSTEPQPAAPAAAPAPAPAVHAEADVLELTQEIEEGPLPAPAPPPQPVQAAAPAPEPVRPAPQDDVVFQSMDEPVVAPA